jgi:hypothetical protein
MRLSNFTLKRKLKKERSGFIKGIVIESFDLFSPDRRWFVDKKKIPASPVFGY